MFRRGLPTQWEMAPPDAPGSASAALSTLPVIALVALRHGEVTPDLASPWGLLPQGTLAWNSGKTSPECAIKNSESTAPYLDALTQKQAMACTAAVKKSPSQHWSFFTSRT